MALTDSEKLAVFQLLDVPMQLPVEFDEDMSKLETNFQMALINQMNTWIINLTLAQETEVKAIVSAFNSIKYDPIRVKTDKVELDYGEKRGLLKRRLLIIFPIITLETDEFEMVVG